MKRILSILTVISLLIFLIPGSKAAAASKTPDFIQGKLSGKLTKDMNGVYKFFNDNKIKFGVEKAESEFIELTSKYDSLGYKHIKTQQVVDGIPVYGSEYIVHFNKNGEIYAVNGSFNPEARKTKTDKTKFIKASKAVEIAEAQVKFDALDKEPSAKLYLYKTGSGYVPVYEVKLSFIYPEPGYWYIYVNAENGSIVKKYNRIEYESGTGTGVLGDTKALNLTYKAGGKKTTSQYQMVDSTRPAVITTYSANYRTRLPGAIVYSLTSTINDPAAVDAHYYAGVVYDYYNNKFGRSGINGSNMAMKSTVHYSRNYVNAFWNGAQMVYGDGDNLNSLALSGSLDVIAHEMTHGVDSFEADLIYENQSGALSESMSDTFGSFVEAYAQSAKFDWLIGEDVWTPKKPGDALRSMADPTLYGDPDNMSGYKNLPNTQAGDWGGVHTNCGIPNKACYLTSTTIGIDKAEKIYYDALCYNMTSSTDFSGAKSALIMSAQKLYGSAEANAVANAWSQVGVN
ncbi:MAG: M4 family metallopeptidase [Bacillota bacterium]|nr:M4 family metallopeptidase [Bacillota bacterium]